MPISRSKSRKSKLNIGTIGHVDHGKTTLSAALNEVLDDRELKLGDPGNIEYAKELLGAMSEDELGTMLEADKLFGRRPYQPPYVRETKKVGRNEPCSCGSGKKNKKCCDTK